MPRKIHNQTLFVAALSVYLGLLIVGAPPQILAQQSKTVSAQADSVKKELSVDDNVSPEVEALLTKGFFVEAVADFLQDLDTLAKIEKYSPRAAFEKPFRFNDEIFVDENLQLRAIHGKQSSDSNKWLATAFRDFEEKLVASIGKDSRLCVYRQNMSFDGALQTAKVELNSNEFTARTSFDAASAETAANLARVYNEVFALGVSRDNKRKAFYENTKASFENNQVFIVTRLPRAGLDALLKANEKAN